MSQATGIRAAITTLTVFTHKGMFPAFRPLGRAAFIRYHPLSEQSGVLLKELA
jgi:hypothetical protein